MIRQGLIALLFFYAGFHVKRPVVTDEVKDEYDFIIVGAGTTGAAVAGRLSEDPSVKILLLEAGGSDLAVPQLRIPYLTPIELTSADWNYKTVPQKFAAQELVGQVDRLPRGKILGGTSSMNHEIYHRGSPHDYNSWVDHGAKGWAWKDVEPFFKRVEQSSEPGLSERLGKSGAVKLTKAYKAGIHDVVAEAARDIGLNETDYIDHLEGVSRVTTTITDGLRINSIEAYLRGEFPERKNRLHVVIGAYATRILFENEGAKEPRAVAVEYIKGGQKRVVSARKEIIVSAGAYETPHLLMLSGIGPREHLDEKNIPVVVDLPGVGSNLQDHVRLDMWFYSDKLPEGTIITSGDITKGISEYLSSGEGPLTTNAGVTSLIHYRTKLAGTPSSQSTRKRPFPEIQLLLSALEQSTLDIASVPYAATFKQQDFIPEMTEALFRRNGVLLSFVIAVGLLHPKSKGEVRLASADPKVHPLIDPNFLSNDDDVKVMLEGLRVVEKIETSPTFQKYGVRLVMQPYCNTTENHVFPRSEKHYRCRLRSVASSELHPCCTAKIGEKSDKDAVVDERLRVYGVRGLRVADASVMPHLVSGNTQGACYMIGEKAAHMIKGDWNMEGSF